MQSFHKYPDPYPNVQLVVKMVVIEAGEEEGEDADGGDGQLEVGAPRQQGGAAQAEETTWRMVPFKKRVS